MASHLQTQFLFYFFQLLLLSVLMSTEVAHVAAADKPILAKPGCSDTCGDVLIPYPFGIGANCSLDHWFEVDCRPNSNGSTKGKPFLSQLKFEVMNIDISVFSTVKVRIPPLNSCRADSHHQQLPGVDLRETPFNYSTMDNVFVMEGCPHSAVLVNQSKKIMAGCGTLCYSDNSAIPRGDCYGVHCCQTRLPTDRFSLQSPLQFYHIDFNGNSSGEHGTCSLASIMDSESMNHYSDGMLSRSSSGLPVVLLWSWLNNPQPPNNPRARCFGSVISNDFLCSCKDGYYGNPYLPNGCQVPEQCKDCHGYCSGDWSLTGHPFLNTYYCDRSPCWNRFLLKLRADFGRTTVVEIVGLRERWPRLREHLNMVYSFVQIGFRVNEKY